MSVQSDTAALACFSTDWAREDTALSAGLDLSDTLDYAARIRDPRVRQMGRAYLDGDHCELGRLLSEITKECES